MIIDVGYMMLYQLQYKCVDVHSYICFGICIGKLFNKDSFFYDLNAFRPSQNNYHFVGNIFKLIFLYENSSTFVQISMEFVCKGPVNKTLPLVHIIVAKPLPMLICITKIHQFLI